MFGHDDSNQSVMGSSTVQNPSMLDNVSQDDFQDSAAPTAVPASDPTADATTTAPAPASTDADAPVPVSVPAETESEHQITTDNPFVAAPVESSAETTITSPDPTPMATPAAAKESASPDPTTASSSGPVAPPVVSDDDAQDQTGYIDALSNNDSSKDDSEQTTEPVDHNKLASMKQEALGHLEPLTDHIGGTPEETFKTTMMMIQANDNHTLLEKALESAKKIEDDKTRAQAMLDIVNEINYFAQTSQES